jgi:hypothetical protein
MKVFENKIKDKFKRQKENVKIKLGEIDSMIDSMVKKQENMFQQTSRKLNSNNLGAVLNHDNDSIANLDKNVDLSNFFVEKTNKSIQTLEDEVRQLKRFLISSSNNNTPVTSNNSNNNTFNISRKETSDSSLQKKQSSVNNLNQNSNDILKDVYDKIKGLNELMGTKLSKEDLERYNKNVQAELEKLVR